MDEDKPPIPAPPQKEINNRLCMLLIGNALCHLAFFDSECEGFQVASVVLDVLVE